MVKGKLIEKFNFAVTAKHPLAKRGLVEMIPTSWVLGIANPIVSPVTNASFGNPELIDLQSLWKDMERNGLRDPFTLSAGRYTRNCRLEASNQRIRLFADHGIEYVPAVTLVADDARIYKGDDHEFFRDLIIPEQDFTRLHLEERINMRPSDVFAEIRALRNAGQISLLTELKY